MVAGKLSLAIGLGFCWVAPASRWGSLTFKNFNNNSITFGGFGGFFLVETTGAYFSKLAKTYLRQFHHLRAGSPRELLCNLPGSARMQGVSPAGTDLWYTFYINSTPLYGWAEPSSSALCTCRFVTQLNSRRNPLNHWCKARTMISIYAQILRSRGSWPARL